MSTLIMKSLGVRGKRMILGLSTNFCWMMISLSLHSANIIYKNMRAYVLGLSDRPCLR
jgi:hypothetical protein